MSRKKRRGALLITIDYPRLVLIWKKSLQNSTGGNIGSYYVSLDENYWPDYVSLF